MSPRGTEGFSSACAQHYIFAFLVAGCHLVELRDEWCPHYSSAFLAAGSLTWKSLPMDGNKKDISHTSWAGMGVQIGYGKYLGFLVGPKATAENNFEGAMAKFRIRAQHWLSLKHLGAFPGAGL